MIKISVDEAAAFDILSIFEIKNKVKEINNISDDNYMRLAKEISDNIGSEKFTRILNSQEYKNLLKDNGQVFGLIELVKQEEDSLANILDEANYQRFISKSKLQKKFFNKELSEKKIGYDKNNSKV